LRLQAEKLSASKQEELTRQILAAKREEMRHFDLTHGYLHLHSAKRDSSATKGRLRDKRQCGLEHNQMEIDDSEGGPSLTPYASCVGREHAATCSQSNDFIASRDGREVGNSPSSDSVCTELDDINFGLLLVENPLLCDDEDTN
jgi:hypothetical protein